MSEAPESSIAAKHISSIFDTSMVSNLGGKEIIEEELEALNKSSGFSSVRVRCRFLHVDCSYNVHCRMRFRMS
jgi:hypothetical protein